MNALLKGLMAATLALFGSMALTGCSTGLDGLPDISSAQTGDYRVDSGDKLKITVQDLDSATGEYVVDDGGAISLPLVKDVAVRGLTYREIETGIEGAYQRDGILTSPVVTVQPVELRPFYVMGEVNRPGEFVYRQGMTVMAALSAAGGYTYRAVQGEVSITRTMDGKEITARAEESTNILPGDRIRVYERYF